MPISFQPANKAELRVEVGKTSLDHLQQFPADAAGKGGGQIRAKANEDGSYTLYVPADTKLRLSGLASALGFKGYGQTERTQKQDLAKDLVKEILSRRLPQEGLAPGATTARTLHTTVGRGGEGTRGAAGGDLGSLAARGDGRLEPQRPHLRVAADRSGRRPSGR